MRRMWTIFAALALGAAGCTEPKPGSDQRLTLHGEFVSGGLSASSRGGVALRGQLITGGLSASSASGAALSGRLLFNQGSAYRRDPETSGATP